MLDVRTAFYSVVYVGQYSRVGITGGFAPSSLCQPPTNIFPILLGVNRNPQFFTVVHCSCLAFSTNSAVFVFRTLVKFTSSILSLSSISQCIVINYN